MDKDSKISKVEVVDKDNNVLISMTYNKIEYDKKFNDNYFELNSIIKTTDNKINDKDIKNNDINQDSSNTNKTENNNNNNEPKENTSGSVNESNNNTNSTITQSNNNSKQEETKTEQTLSIDDVIYPMYLPDNTYLTSQERIDTESGERLILTFSGDNPFVLVEETISNDNSNVIIPVNGEFDFLSDVIGVIGNNSIMWHSNGVEYYMTSNVVETSVLVDIARSISILPVSK